MCNTSTGRPNPNPPPKVSYSQLVKASQLIIMTITSITKCYNVILPSLSSRFVGGRQITCSYSPSSALSLSSYFLCHHSTCQNNFPKHFSSPSHIITGPTLSSLMSDGLSGEARGTVAAVASLLTAASPSKIGLEAAPNFDELG